MNLACIHTARTNAIFVRLALLRASFVDAASKHNLGVNEFSETSPNQGQGSLPSHCSR